MAPRTLYAIGDVHGRADLLEPLLTAIGDDAGARGETPLAVFLGDLIDRGPDSRQAMELMLSTLNEWPGSRLILGNHEEFMLRFVTDPAGRAETVRVWLYNGAETTLASYGLSRRDDIDAIADALAERFPAHIAALRRAEFMIEHGDFVLVHGGIDPALGLHEQDPHETRWIRDPFLDHRGPLPKIVVHGHTPTVSRRPEVHSNRIGLDTGAVHSGRLTCAVISDGGDQVRFLATDGSGAVSEISPI